MAATTGGGAGVPEREAATAVPATSGEDPALAAGQRIEQAPPPPVLPKPVPASPAPVTVGEAAGSADQAAQPAAAEEVAAVASPAPPMPAAPPPPPIAQVFQCRKGAEFHVDPEEVLVTIDGRLLGKADDWDGAGGGDTYYFPGPGDYLVELALAGFRTVWVKVVVTPAAKRDVVDVDTELEEIE
jgi:hypothetical protein